MQKCTANTCLCELHQDVDRAKWGEGCVLESGSDGMVWYGMVLDGQLLRFCMC